MLPVAVVIAVFVIFVVGSGKRWDDNAIAAASILTFLCRAGQSVRLSS